MDNRFEDGVIKEVGRGRAKTTWPRESSSLPSINAHTHIADYVVPVDLSLSLAEVVAPRRPQVQGAGIHPEQKQRDAIALMSRTMFAKHRGLRRFPRGRVKGRPHVLATWARPFVLESRGAARFEQGGDRRAVEITDGIGPSAISDWDYEELREMSEFRAVEGKDLRPPLLRKDT
jgi:hypothetical protein